VKNSPLLLPQNLFKALETLKHFSPEINKGLL